MKTRAHQVGRHLGFNTREHHAIRTPRTVADFNTLDDLIAHARDELGASHVVVAGPESKIYFPRGGTHAYEAASVRRKGGYWHADGPGAREGVRSLPAAAQPIGGGRVGRRAAAPRPRPPVREVRTRSAHHHPDRPRSRR